MLTVYSNVVNTQGVVVKLVATASIVSPSGSRQLEQLEFRARVLPSSRPSVLHVYQADNKSQPLPVDAAAEDLTFTLLQEAGKQVNPDYMLSHSSVWCCCQCTQASAMCKLHAIQHLSC